MIDGQTAVELLGKSELFHGIPHSILSPLFKQSMQIPLQRGAQLLTPGVLNEYVYIIISGQLSVHLTPESMNDPIAILDPGDCVGEMSVLVDRKVSAYVTANTDSQLLAISYSSFWGLIKGSSDAAFNMLNILVQRIRMGNEIMTDSLSRDKETPGKKPLL